MTKWHAHVVHMAKHMNLVGGPRTRPLAPHTNQALASATNLFSFIFSVVNFVMLLVSRLRYPSVGANHVD